MRSHIYAKQLLPLLKLEPGSAEEYAARKRLRKKLAKNVCEVLLTIALVVTLLILHKRVEQTLGAFIDWCETWGWAAPLFIGLGEAVMIVFMLPTFPLMVGAGVVLPRMWGMKWGQAAAISAVFAGEWLGSMIAFVIGRTVLRRWAEEKMGKLAWFHVVSAMITEEGWWIILLARMSPILPTEVFNFACCLTPVSLWGYAVGGFGAVIPICMWIFVTASASHGLSPPSGRRSGTSQVYVILFNVTFLLMVSWIFVKLYRKYQAREENYVNKLVSSLTIEFTDEQHHAMKKLITKGAHRMETDPDDVHHQLVQQYSRRLSQA